MDLEGICASGGSACSSGATKGSHVLTAIDALRPGQASVRFSFGRYTAKEEIDQTIDILERLMRWCAERITWLFLLKCFCIRYYGCIRPYMIEWIIFCSKEHRGKTPQLSKFYVLIIYMYYFDNIKHHVPHILVHYQNQSCVMSIATQRVLSGSIPSNRRKLGEGH